ncbi:hypothetical protein L209DRAFT_92227 [Thermothelomyces heterothallicus CBS 203.75]
MHCVAHLHRGSSSLGRLWPCRPRTLSKPSFLSVMLGNDPCGTVGQPEGQSTPHPTSAQNGIYDSGCPLLELRPQLGGPTGSWGLTTVPGHCSDCRPLDWGPLAK